MRSLIHRHPPALTVVRRASCPPPGGRAWPGAATARRVPGRGVLHQVLSGLAVPWLAALAAPLALAQGDAAQGEAIALSRSQGLCVLCHALPGQNPALQGNIGPPLAGVGGRLDADSLRQRLVAPERFNPDTVMPSYGRSTGLQQVARAQHGKPLLTEPQIDDLVAWLATLR